MTKARWFTITARLAAQLAAALRLTLTRTSRADGKVLGPVTYTFTSEAQRDAFVAGRWP